MRRHETDWLSLVFGGLFVVVAAVHLGTDGNGDPASLRWVIPVVLVVLGVLGLAGALRGREPAGDAVAAPGAGTDPTPGDWRDAGPEEAPEDGPDEGAAAGDGTEDTLRL